MTGLLNSLTQIALLRKDPGGLPSSAASVVVFTTGYVAADVLIGLAGNFRAVLPRSALELALTLPFFWLLLALTHRAHRFAQTVNAAFGVYVLIAPALAVLLLPMRMNGPFTLFATAIYTGIAIWYILVVGYVFKCALDTHLVTGFAIAIAWILGTRAVSNAFFGPVS
jgi:hypothetical protein